MLWRLLIPTAFPFFPEKLYFCLWLWSSTLGRVSGKAGALSTPQGCLVWQSLSPIHPTPALSLLPLAFPFFCSITHLGT